MTKAACKGLRKDGKPCQGLGQPQFDGYCIAHAPAHKTHEWRSRGGKASSAAARADKRIPDRLRRPIDLVTQGMEDLVEGKIEPAALSALCRAAKTLADLYRLADAEMELIHDEETGAAAAQTVGVFGDPDLLDQAAALAARQRRYTIESFIEQGLVTLESRGNKDEDLPPQPVLTDAGRRRFGYQRITSYTQEALDDLKDEINVDLLSPPKLRELRDILARMRSDVDQALHDLSHDPGPVRDPLTGQALSQPPAGVLVGILPAADPGDTEKAAQILQDQRRQVIEMTRELEAAYGGGIDFNRLFASNESAPLSDLTATLKLLAAVDNPP